MARPAAAKNIRTKPVRNHPPVEQTLFVSLSVSLAFEALLFYTGMGNAFTVPKAAVVLLSAAIVIPQICFLLLHGRMSLQRPLIFLLSFQLLATTISTLNSMSPTVSFWGGDWRRMGWITQFALLSTCLAVSLAIGSHFARWKRPL